MRSVWQALADGLRAGEMAVLVTVVQAKGSVPRGAGARMAVFPDGRAEGTVGGGAMEYAAKKLALDLMGGAGRMQSFSLTREDAAGLGMICGGDVTLLFHPFSPGDGAALAVLQGILSAMDERSPRWLSEELCPDGSVGTALYGRDGLVAGNAPEAAFVMGALPAYAAGEKPRFADPVVRAGRALIFGGGHVSRALTPILASVEFPVFVFEDREEFADPARFPGATGTMLCDFGDFLNEANIVPEDFVVIVTRGHQADYEVLRQVLSTQAVYIGMIGSRAKIAATKDRLTADGFAWDDLARVYAPIGLAIGAQTPEEIAVSIAAEMIKRRSQLN